MEREIALPTKVERHKKYSPEDHYQYIKKCIHAAVQEAKEKSSMVGRRNWNRYREQHKEPYLEVLSTKINTDKMTYKKGQVQVIRKIVQKNET